MSREREQVKKKFLALMALVLGLTVLTGCAQSAPQDKVGIWVNYGQIIDDGRKFDHCIASGTVDAVSLNDDIYWVEDSLRTWNVAPESQGGDQKEPLTLTAKPEKGQQTGLQVQVWVQVNFKLNTYCGSDERDANAALPQWWKNIGDRYDADTPEGWIAMLRNTVVPALEKGKNVLRDYTADELVGATVWADAEKKFGTFFSEELTRLAGGNYFCGPTFTRTSPECPSIAISIKDVDLEPSVQAARNEKQRALEQAQAQVAEAQGKVQAAAAQDQLYKNPAWMELERAKIQLEVAKACASSQKCTMVIDSSGGVQVHTS